MPYDTKAVANLLLDLARKEQIPISPMKLQKLIYFAHGWHLALNGEPLIDEPIQAWQYGPVVSSLYQEFRRFGTAPIQGLATKWDDEEGQLVAPVLSKLDRQKVQPLLEKILSIYGGFTAIKLSNLTHEPETPWAKAWRLGHGKHHVHIDDDLIAKFFTDELSRIK